MIYKRENIVVLGLGKTGYSCVNFLISKGIIPYVMDTRLHPPFENKLPKFIKYNFGKIKYHLLINFSTIIISPGLVSYIPKIKNITKNNGIKIIGDIELFFREIKVPVIAVTGTNGKSTVVTMLYEMVKFAGKRVKIGGNIGLPALELLNKSIDMCILELSSFQLETTNTINTVSSAILNISEDHNDIYKNNKSKYQLAKMKIFKNTQTCVFNANDKLTKPKNCTYKRHISFGINNGNYNLHFEKNNILIKINNAKVINISHIKLTGTHNYVNATAALAIAESINLPIESSIKALSNFKELKHRMQFVHVSKGIRWINDSKSTNPSSTIAAVNTLKNIPGTIWLLLGGDSKSANLALLKQYLSKIKNLRIICFGKDRQKLFTINKHISLKTINMFNAIQKISNKINSGDIILLSPACASTDQFKNFKHRGKYFMKLAKKFGK